MRTATLSTAYNAWALLMLLVALVAQHSVAADKAPAGYGCRCVYVALSIYCYGGATSYLNDIGTQGTQQFFTLNVSNPITVADNSSSWTMVDFKGQTVQPEPNAFFAMAAMDRTDRKLIVMEGGAGRNDGSSLQHTTLYYDINAGQWGIIDSGNRLQRRFGTLIFDKVGNDDRFFAWGGDSSLLTGYQNTTSGNYNLDFDMAVLSYEKWQWISPTNNIQNLSSLMLPRTQHAAAQGGDGRVYIAGGLEAYTNASVNGSVVYEFFESPMTDILVYDINTGWDMKKATGDIPSDRMFHTMVTSTDGKSIILYGGAQTLSGLNNLPLAVRDVAYVLDISDPDHLVWKNVTDTLIKNVGLSVLNSNHYARFDHSSILLNDSLFILFGGDSGGIQTEFFIIDTVNWNLTNSFDGANALSKSSGDVPSYGGGYSGTTGLSGGAIAGIVVGVVVGLGIIGGAIIFLLIRRKRQATKPSVKQGDNKVHSNDSSEPMQSFLPPSYQEAATTHRQEYLSSKISEVEHASPTRSSMDQTSPMYQNPTKPDSDTYYYPSTNPGSLPLSAGVPEVYVPKLRLMPVKPDGE